MAFICGQILLTQASTLEIGILSFMKGGYGPGTLSAMMRRECRQIARWLLNSFSNILLCFLPLIRKNNLCPAIDINVVFIMY